jgi:phosphohistidine phosphatase
MRALLVRHAVAEDRVAWAARGRDDAERPLSDLAWIAVSPAARTQQTAALLAAALPGEVPIVTRPELAPSGSASGALELLQSQRGLAALALIGHEPNLSQLAGLLLAGRERSLLAFKKGGAALFDFPGRVAAGEAVLLWHLPPAALRRLD